MKLLSLSLAATALAAPNLIIEQNIKQTKPYCFTQCNVWINSGYDTVRFYFFVLYRDFLDLVSPNW